MTAPAVSARLRYYAKPHGEGRKQTWAVYDRLLGSEPRQRPGIGRIEQDHPDEESAQREADRLNAPCGHAQIKRGCGGCDPSAIEFVITDDGVRRPFDPAQDMLPADQGGTE